MTPGELSQWIREQGRAVGFDRVGIAPVTDSPELAFFPEWKQRGYAGEMDYLAEPRREDVRKLLPEARSVICCALVYNTPLPYSTEVPPDPERGWISRYAWGDDYHQVMKAKLEAFRAAIGARVGDGFVCKLYVDTGPVLERVYGKYAGLGWIAKNTCLLDAELGSWFFTGVLVTNLALEPDTSLPDGCGACTLCLEACPTGALSTARPYIMDARRCISYLTIELRSSIPEELRGPMGRHVFGCDICQDVCPYNRKPWLTQLAAFQPRQIKIQSRSFGTKTETPKALSPAAPRKETTEPPGPPRAASKGSRLGVSPDAGHRLAPSPDSQTGQAFEIEGTLDTGHESLFHPSLEWLASLSEDDFRRVFKNSAIKRAKWRGLLRNVLVAMGNSANRRFRPILEKFASASDSLLSEHAQWALKRLSNH